MAQGATRKRPSRFTTAFSRLAISLAAILERRRPRPPQKKPVENRLAGLNPAPLCRSQAFLPVLGRWLLRSPLHPLYLRLTGQRDPVAEYRAAYKECPPVHAELFYRPLISVLLPVHNARHDWLAQAIESVRAQSYPEWELCIWDDASRQAWQPPTEPRIRYGRSAERMGISGALNQAARMARGEYLTFLDHDDFLSPAALGQVVAALQNDRAEFVYSDEDYVDARGRPVLPHLKPDWSPDLLARCMYIGHMMVVSRARFEQLGGFRSEYDGAQDYDLALRLAEACGRAAHVRRVLYHWRQHAGSVARTTAAKPYTHLAGMRALEDAMRRRGWAATVREGAIPNEYALEWPAVADSADVVCLVGDVEALTPDWRARVAAELARPGIGVVGARITKPDGTIHHAGLAVSRERGPFSPGEGTRGLPFWKWLSFTREVTAVGGGFLAARRSLYEELGGLDPQFPQLGEVDFCLRARALGWPVLYLNDVAFRARRMGPVPPAEADELATFGTQWSRAVGQRDAFYGELDYISAPPNSFTRFRKGTLRKRH